MQARAAMQHSASTSGRDQQSQAKSLGPRRLMEVLESFYVSFNPAAVTLDTHIDACVASTGGSDAWHSDDEMFVRQVLYGAFRYGQLLNVLLESFYFYNRWV